MALEKPYGKPITFHPCEPEQLRGELIDSMLAWTQEEKAYHREMFTDWVVQAFPMINENFDNPQV